MTTALLLTFVLAGHYAQPVPTGPSHWTIDHLYTPPGAAVRVLNVRPHWNEAYEPNEVPTQDGFVVDIQLTVPGVARDLDMPIFPSESPVTNGEQILVKTSRVTWHLNLAKAELHRWRQQKRLYTGVWREGRSVPDHEHISVWDPQSKWEVGTVTLRGRDGGKIVMY